MRARIYIDTSVIGGCCDSQFRDVSKRLIDKCTNGDVTAVVSDLTILELKTSPKPVRTVLGKIPDGHIEYVELTEEAFNLAHRYISEGIVASRNLVDAEHIAVATVSRVDVLVSWNFRHIVNLHRIHGFNGVSLRLGYPMLEIRSPREVIRYEPEEKGI